MTSPAPVATTVDRATLYTQVWAAPMTAVALQYGVSSSYLARICDRMNVPRPPRGYWAQLEFGKPPKRPDLPDPRPGDLHEWTRGQQLQQSPPALPKAPEERQKTPVRRRVPQGGRHPLVVEAPQHFDGVRESDNGYLRPTKRRLVDVFVTKESLHRALDVLNELFQELESRGHHVVLPAQGQHLSRPTVDERTNGGRDRGGYGLWAPDRPTVTYVGTVAIGLTIFERSEELEVRYVGGKYVPISTTPAKKPRGSRFNDTWTHTRDVPTGRLCVRASSPYHDAPWEKEWREKRKGEMSSQIRSIVRVLESEAATIAGLVEDAAHRAELAHQEWERQRQIWEREAAERRRIKNLREAQEELAAVVAAWNADKQTAAFFEDAERHVTAMGGEERDALLDRLRRARELLGSVDALERLTSWRSPEER